MSTLEIGRIYTQSFIKEMRVMESVRRITTINYNPYFGAYDEQIHPMIAANPAIAKYIHQGIDKWIATAKKRVLFPSISSKTVSKATSNLVRSLYPDYVPFGKGGITPIDLERIYHNEGYMVGGPCEMRQKWYPSNLQPRTYYAMGGDAFHTSKYLADLFVELCDILPATNRLFRVDPSRIAVRSPSGNVAYYDLASFTSNLHEHSEFMHRLASYCSGHMVQLLDSKSGIVTVDLGELVHVYTVQNLEKPEYTIPAKYGDSSQVHHHNVAGFLGVYGNIATATFLHGIVMAMLHTELDENNVAGDDGLDVTEDVDYTLEVVGLLGEVHDEKTFRDSEGCCIHLKRPVARIGERLHHGTLVVWPSLEQGQEVVDARYPYIREYTRREKKDAVAGSVTALLRSLVYLDLEEEELDLVDTFVKHVYDAYSLPLEGCVPQVSQRPSGFVPMYAVGLPGAAKDLCIYVGKRRTRATIEGVFGP